MSEVDGSPSDSRFGGGQSDCRTKTPPTRCASLWTGRSGRWPVGRSAPNRHASSARHCKDRRPRKLRTFPRRLSLTAALRIAYGREAPSTERPRLMALRVATASAEVSRIAGRRRHRLGAFSLSPVRSGRCGCEPIGAESSRLRDRHCKSAFAAPATRSLSSADATVRSPRQLDHLRRRDAVHGIDAPGTGLRRGVRPLEDGCGVARGGVRRRSPLRRHSRRSRRCPLRSRRAPSSGGSSCWGSQASHSRSPAVPWRSASLASSKASLAPSPGPEHSRGWPPSCRGRSAARCSGSRSEQP